MSIDPTSNAPLELSRTRSLPSSAWRFEFIKSGGPGGQHVNKTATQAVLIVDLKAVEQAIGPEAVHRLKTSVSPSRVSGDHELHIACGNSRSQIANRRACLVRLASLLRAAMQRPKQRKRTRPTRGSIERRIESKKQRGTIKRNRRAPRRDRDA